MSYEIITEQSLSKCNDFRSEGEISGGRLLSSSEQ